MRLNQIRHRTLLALAFAVFALAELSQLVVQTGGWGVMPAFWPPLGLLLGVLLVTEPRWWPRLVVTGCLAMALSDAFHDRGAAAAALAALIRGGEAWGTAFVVRRILGRRLVLDRLADSLALIVGTSIVPLAGALAASSLPPLAGSASVLSMCRAWYLADTVGIMATTPLVVAVVTASPAAILAYLRGWTALELAIVFAGGMAVFDGVFAGGLDPALRVPAFLLPFILWPALRLGPGASAAVVFTLTFGAMLYSANGQGPAALFGVRGALLRAQAGAVLMTASLYLLATVVAERKRVGRERDVLVGELQQALGEIKTLRGFIPICAWCHKIRDDAGLWHQLERYLDERTGATFSHGICPECEEKQTHSAAGGPAW